MYRLENTQGQFILMNKKTSMTAWEILGIDKTTDVKAIRHAYAQLAKQCHPETEPEQFEQLYRVYQEALAFAKGKQQMPAVEHAQEKTAQKQNAKKEHTAERTGGRFHI